MARADGHVSVDIARPDSIFFATAQLEKLHRQFIYPSANKLYELLKKARPEETSQDALETMEDLTRHCDACHRIQTAPERFRVSPRTDKLGLTSKSTWT